MVYVYENVTEQLNLESSYNTLARVQRETIDQLYEGVAVFGTDGRLKLSNPAYARIWSLTPEDLAGEPHASDIEIATAALYQDRVQAAGFRLRLTNDNAVRTTTTGRLERADDRVIDYAIVPLSDGATLLTYVDVTDGLRVEQALRERNDALETADRLKSEFISHVSYQLRTPLTNILGFGEILETEMFGELNKKQHEYTRGILESSDTLLDVVNDILDLAVIEAGDTITIGAKRTNDQVELFVADTGIGIKPEYQATVFDRFEAHSGADRRRGAGLGLSLVRSFVELHGGTVTLESEPGVGTRVTCLLPLRATATLLSLQPVGVDTR